jgi:general secretion pathway protein K
MPTAGPAKGAAVATFNPRSRRGAPDRGAALLLAMLILTLIATLAAGMVWQQFRAIQVEAAERGRTQAAWILSGALDWARLILREDARTGGADHLGEPWAVPLAEARLSSFLAADRDNNAADSDALDAFLSGSITDAQAKWNVRRLVDASGKPVEAEVRVLQRLCDQSGAPSDCAERVTGAMASAYATAPRGADAQGGIAPRQLSELAWLGVDPETIRRLEPWVVVLPAADTTVNVNTAPAEVIAAVVDGMSLGSAQRLVQERSRLVIRDVSVAPARSYFPPDPQTKLDGLGVSSRYFFVQGRLRLDSRVVEQRSLVERRQLDMVVLSRERLNLHEGP